ncbi:hypothetical protein Lser_V15G10338 [Lactuca serriola]
MSRHSSRTLPCSAVIHTLYLAIPFGGEPATTHHQDHQTTISHRRLPSNLASSSDIEHYQSDHRPLVFTVTLSSDHLHRLLI